MDDRRSADALTDAAIDREIEMALAVNPSAEFLAQVRAGVASAPSPQRGLRTSWVFVGGAVLAVTIALVMARSRNNSLDFDVRPSWESTQPRASVAESQPSLPPVVHSDVRSRAKWTLAKPPRSSSAVTDVARAEAEPEVLISAEQAALVSRLLARARRGDVDLSSLPEMPAPTVALRAPSEITLAPIEFAPVTAAAPEEGERQ
jgi:hypothetical protein